MAGWEGSGRSPPGTQAVPVLGRAGWHTAKTLKRPDNITLVPPPPMSPDLHRVENLWQHLRQSYLSNRVFDSYDAILARPLTPA